jgi:uncharacterized repeat protein (TIGR02543 family)
MLALPVCNGILRRRSYMCFKKVHRFFAALVFTAIFSVGCSSDVNSKGHQNPDGRQTYFVTLDTQGAQEWDPITVYEGDNLEGRLQEPTKEGFLFEGWSSSGDEYVAYDLANEVTSDLTLYAKWDGQSIVPAETYRLTVHLMGGAILNVPLQDIPINHKGNKTLQQLPRLNQHPNPPPEFSMGESRKVFSVWNTEPDGSGEYIFPGTLIAGNLDIYAMYAKPLGSVQDLRDMECNNPDVWYAYERILLTDTLTEPLCQDPNAPFRGKILPGFPESTSPPYYGSIRIIMSAPRTHAGLFAYTDGADLVSLRVQADIQNVSYATGGLAAEAKNTRLISNYVGPAQYNDLGGRYAWVKSDGHTGGIVGIGDNVTISGTTATVRVSGKYVGGVAGWLTNSRLSGAHYETSPMEVSADNGYGGGVVGYMDNGTITSPYYSIQNTYFEIDQKLTSAYPNVSMGTIAGYLKDVDLRNMNITSRCPIVLAERENSFVGMVGTLDGGSIKDVTTCDRIAIYGINSTAGGLVGRMLNNASIENVIIKGAVRGDVGVPPAGSRVGGIVGEASGGRIKSALAMNHGLVGETIGPIAGAASSTEITQSHFIAGIQSIFTNYGNISGDVVNHYDFYDNRTFFEDALGWDFDTVWEMRDYYEMPVAKGSGTDFIPINNAEELHNITSGNYVLMNDIDLSTFNGGVWTPISFSGTLHGNNKKITNLRTTGGGGLISGSGSVRHLTIENFNFTYLNGEGTGAAPLSGCFSVRDVHTSGVIGNNMVFNTAAGVLISSCVGASVSDSSFTGTINIRGAAGSSKAAGIMVGSGRVSSSKSSGRISALGRVSGVTEASGSMLGEYGRVRSSYSDMDIVLSPAEVGGISFDASSDTFGNYFAGSINLGSSSGSAGGISSRIGGNNVNKQVIKTNLVLTDRITVGCRIFCRPLSNSFADDNYALPTLANGAGVNGTDLTVPVDNAFLKSLDWDMSLWKPVVPGTLPKLWWEE